MAFQTLICSVVRAPYVSNNFIFCCFLYCDIFYIVGTYFKESQMESRIKIRFMYLPTNEAITICIHPIFIYLFYILIKLQFMHFI